MSDYFRFECGQCGKPVYETSQRLLKVTDPIRCSECGRIYDREPASRFAFHFLEKEKTEEELRRAGLRFLTFERTSA